MRDVFAFLPFSFRQFDGRPPSQVAISFSGVVREVDAVGGAGEPVAARPLSAGLVRNRARLRPSAAAHLRVLRCRVVQAVRAVLG
jgi:hypothetical protein